MNNIPNLRNLYYSDFKVLKFNLKLKNWNTYSELRMYLDQRQLENFVLYIGNFFDIFPSYYYVLDRWIEEVVYSKN